MRRLIIAVDCDDVLVATTPFFVDAYNQAHGTHITVDKAYHDDAELWQADRPTLEERLSQLMKTDAYKMLRPTDEEVAVLTRLSKDHELHVITARRPEEREHTQAMLDTYLPGVFTSLDLVGFKGSKGEACEKLGADMLIDDNAGHLGDAVAHGLSKDGVILFGDYAWTTKDSSFVRAYTWSEIEERINDFAR